MLFCLLARIEAVFIIEHPLGRRLPVHWFKLDTFDYMMRRNVWGREIEAELAEMKAKEQLARVDAEVVRRQLVAAQTQNQAEAELDAEAHNKVPSGR